ncbi:putative ribosome quality control (RQC) complex YloA/Tae2 family protein [Psychrobacillus insolitus]|uniref:Rqc2 homolog RqcH n=1 Tax=Psychrobacillus insolitus TaxID=1461 RepID=A0A2W7MW05_9BACI|nr:NFACT RNA binding domain-containing protein [Psychrobacillus insolitus]PZX07991.1 putative ribosome quality control (RQC) complex YloA/Tae2 family protein [Psychrobacillus insolitus]
MAFDGLFTRSMTIELQQLVTGRISKIHQPNAQEILMHIRAQGKNFKLLFSVHPSYSRVQITNETIDNPATPPLFCMVLRKHIEGGVIASIRQHETDRIIIFQIHSKNEIGDDMTREIHMEIMGRHSNLLLVDPSRNLLLESIKHLSPSMNSYRTILPGQPYLAPPAQNKLHPFEITDELVKVIQSVNESSEIVEQISGFSPLHAKELLHRFNETTERLEVYKAYMKEFEQGGSTKQIVDVNGKTFYSPNALTHLVGDKYDEETLGNLLDRVYFAKAERDRVKQQAGDLERWLLNELSKLKLKMKKLKKDFEQAENLDTFLLYGELLMANAYAIEKGLKEVELVNYYDENEKTVLIPLDIRKTASQNAQRYYSRYSKAKTALLKIQQQFDITKDDITYFELLLQQVMQASPTDIEEIREELIEQGLLKARASKKKKKPTKPSPEKFIASDGTEISVGKNNKQNDFVTFKLARKTDTWLHTKDIPGSHVVIHSDNPSETALLEAANLAAYFSKARESASVPVDYTVVKQVKKPSGAKPGFVIYFEQNTVFVTPDEEMIRQMKK